MGKGKEGGAAPPAMAAAAAVAVAVAASSFGTRHPATPRAILPSAKRRRSSRLLKRPRSCEEPRGAALVAVAYFDILILIVIRKRPQQGNVSSPVLNFIVKHLNEFILSHDPLQRGFELRLGDGHATRGGGGSGLGLAPLLWPVTATPTAARRLCRGRRGGLPAAQHPQEVVDLVRRRRALLLLQLVAVRLGQVCHHLPAAVAVLRRALLLPAAAIAVVVEGGGRHLVREGDLRQQVEDLLALLVLVEPQAQQLLLTGLVHDVRRLLLEVGAIQDVLQVVLRAQPVQNDELEPRQGRALHDEQRALHISPFPLVQAQLKLVQ
mmetsp:Transcript_4151/g.10628  ORF Transcript_4151/g.10628 Transcript_4151/m.10628 type:complete len:322 (-) Transcript_4151:198-1163(-)